MAKAAPKTNTTVNPTEDELLEQGKGRPTPSRREREAANRRPLVGNSPADKKAARARLNTEREKARVGMANGEERYLPAKDRGEQRRFVRDWIDARWNVGEVMMPVLVIFLILGFAAAQTVLASYALLLVWAFVALFVLDCVVSGCPSARSSRTSSARCSAGRSSTSSRGRGSCGSSACRSRRCVAGSTPPSDRARPPRSAARPRSGGAPACVGRGRGRGRRGAAGGAARRGRPVVCGPGAPGG